MSQFWLPPPQPPHRRGVTHRDHRRPPGAPSSLAKRSFTLHCVSSVYRAANSRFRSPARRAAIRAAINWGAPGRSRQGDPQFIGNPAGGQKRRNRWGSHEKGSYRVFLEASRLLTYRQRSQKRARNAAFPRAKQPASAHRTAVSAYTLRRRRYCLRSASASARWAASNSAISASRNRSVATCASSVARIFGVSATPLGVGCLSGFIKPCSSA